MPVKKGKKKNGVDKELKKQIKDTVEKLPQLIAEEIKETEEKNTKTINSTYYDNPTYKKKKIIMWVFVVIFFLVILFMWIINANSVFYDFNKSLEANNNPSVLTKGKDAFTETYNNDWENLLAEIDSLLKKNVDAETEEIKKEKKINLSDIVNAVNNFNSTTQNTVTSTEE